MALVLVGCEEDLGPCDPDKAITPVFTNGMKPGSLPMYAGQALVVESCGSGTFCHSEIAVGADRFGAPAGLDFDVQIACRVKDAACVDETELLRRGQARVHEFRHEIWDTVESGYMPPPGEARESTVVSLGLVDIDGNDVPSLDTAEGKEILRNWLACREPVVERTSPHPDLPDPPAGENNGGALVGDWFLADDALPTWESVFASIIQPECVNCHGGNRSYTEDSKLDLEDPDAAYETLLGTGNTRGMRMAAGSECAGRSDAALVVPGDPEASLLVHKVENEAPDGELCGDKMPVMKALDPSLIEIIRVWIACGADKETDMACVDAYTTCLGSMPMEVESCVSGMVSDS